MVVKPPSNMLTLCAPLEIYKTNDVKTQLKVTIKNHEVYYLCASKLKSAVMFLESM